MAWWLSPAARARWRVKSFGDLVRLGVLVPREANEITAVNDFLWSVRNHLHHHAGRRSDRLTFEEQEVTAREMGYHAKVGGVMQVALPRPRSRKALLEHPDYYAYRQEVLDFLAGCERAKAEATAAA